jgi:hypothetical protein
MVATEVTGENSLGTGNRTLSVFSVLAVAT